MEVRKGYKQTEVGVIPEDWKLKKCGEVGSFYKGKGISSKDLVADGLPCIMYGDIYVKYDTKFSNPNFRITKQTAINSSLAKTGDLFFTGSGETAEEIGKCVVYQGNDDMYIGGDIIALTPNSDNDSLFLAYMQNSKILLSQKANLGQGHTVVHIYTEHIKSLNMPLPPTKAEQTAIATALSDADALIIRLEKLIAKKRNIKQGAMQELLTGKKRLPGFSGKWEVKKLGEIGEITGAGVDKKIKPDEVPVRLVNYLDVYRRDFIYSRHLNHYVTAPPAQAQRCSVKKGDIFFTPSSEMPFDIGISAVAMEDIPDAAYSYHVVRLRLNEDWDLAFRAYIFKTRYFLNQAEIFCEGSGTRYVITQKRFRELTIYYPIDKTEQIAIAKTLSDMDAEIEQLEQKLDKFKMIKQGMMQQLLTGKTRLI